ncbi:hypothetical protein HYPSUDRAFT_1070935 [Hypholoma sublateritium FD-334 SS-4]|uniref:Uncharacterized protein n=1 Tax=Hypholoma sublateritium (strain FD-334 SS-4) TaxID=945553 RepID=A0A0D2KJT1_HYPSF|nr:hypothetical protein HYPSUDRAFT_1070935 [Hypholoma sublateritium FD-334 SS-4]
MRAVVLPTQAAMPGEVLFRPALTFHNSARPQLPARANTIIPCSAVPALRTTALAFMRVARTPRIYAGALERYRMACRGFEWGLTVPFADQLWERLTALEDAAIHDGKPLPVRMAEHVQTSHRHDPDIYTATDTVSHAIAQLRAFAKHLLNQVRTPLPKPVFHATCTSLVGARLLMRMVGATKVPDDHVSPLIVFRHIAPCTSRARRLLDT